jgi:hypothetical protein
MAETEKQRLITALNASRADLTKAGRGLRRELSFSDKLRRSVAENRAIWLGAGLVVGLLITRKLTQPPPVKTHKVKIKRGAEPADMGKAALIPLAAKFIFDMAKPTLMVWLREKAFGGLPPRAKR